MEALAGTPIQADFDRIARLSGEGWDHNAHYHRTLLNHLPTPCESALDAGCGTGAFSRLLAARADRVVALDLSPGMIEVARERSRHLPNLHFEVADLLQWDPHGEQFDCVASIAMLHHVPARPALAAMAGLLKVGGTLAVLDLYRARGPLDLLRGAAAVPLSLALRLLHTGRLRLPRDVRAAWAAHGRHDTYPTLAAVRQACESVLPGARVTQHLLFRYSIVWKKQDGLPCAWPAQDRPRPAEEWRL